MKRAIIFLNGIHHNVKKLYPVLRANDTIIAVDGGARHCQKLGIHPSFVIGDMDSISPTLLNKLKKTDTVILTYPIKKDETDFELALDLAISKKVTEVLIIGGVGNRLDMTLSNIFILTQPKLKHQKITVLTDTEELTLLRSGTTHLKGIIGNRLSLIPITHTVKGVTLHGFQYPLNNENIRFGSVRTISNFYQCKNASVQIKTGILLCITN